jgi:hypothetical protein
MTEADGICQRQCGHIADGVSEKHPVDNSEVLPPGADEQKNTADQMESGKEIMRSEEAVCNGTSDDWREYCRDSRSTGDQADTFTVKMQAHAQPCARSNVPRAPNEVLEKHHEGETNANTHDSIPRRHLMFWNLSL